MDFFKELNEIYFVDKDNQDIILAEKDGGIWICLLCDENENLRVKMLTHIRNHIKVR